MKINDQKKQIAEVGEGNQKGTGRDCDQVSEYHLWFR